MGDIDYEAIRARVDQRVASRTNIRNSLFFIINLLLYVGFIFISVFGITGASRVNFLGTLGIAESTLIYAFIGWGICIFFYGVSVWANDPRQVRKTRKRLVEQELAKGAADTGLEKSKRHELPKTAFPEAELTNNGERDPTEEKLDTPQSRVSPPDIR